MARTDLHFMFLCFTLLAFLSLVASEYKLYNSRNRSKYAGVQYVQSSDVEKTDIRNLLNNKCNFFIVEKTIFYACPKRPTRYPFLNNEVFRDDNGHQDRGGKYSHSEKFECPFPFGTHPHPKDCRKYYLCIFDKPRTMTCDSSKLYDEYKGECAEKSTVDCGDRTGGITTKGTTRAPGQKTTSAVKTTTKKVEKFKCPYTWGTFPNPDDCSQYYLCLNKRHTLKKCKPTELYDTEINECKDEDEVDCGSRFNPRVKTTKRPTTAAITTRPTTSATTTKEKTTSITFEDSTSESSAGDISEAATESSTSIDVSPSSELKTTHTDEVESTTGEINTSEEPVRSTEEPATTDGNNSEIDKSESTTEKPEITEDDSETDEPEPSSEQPVITHENTSDSGELEQTSENPRITDDKTLETAKPELTSEKSEITDYTSESDNPKLTSVKPKITDNDVSGKPEITVPNTEETELTSEESLEVTETTSKPTEEETTNKDSDHSEEPEMTGEDHLSQEPQTTENGSTSETAKDETPSKESDAPLEETTPSAELRSSLPDDNTGSDEENSTDGEEETDYATEEASTSFEPKSTANYVVSSEEPHSPTENKISKALPYSTPSIDSNNTEEVTGTSAQFETTATVNISPEISQPTDDNREISSSSIEFETSEPPELFVCPKGKGNFPHKDCSLYYACRKGAYKIEKCLEGTLFHSGYGTCDNEDEVDCGERIRPDGDKMSTVTYISSTFPTDRPMTETTADNDTSSQFSKSFDNTDETVDYTSRPILETNSTSNYDTENTNGTSYFDSTDFTSKRNTEHFETPSTSGSGGTRGTQSETDYETFEISTGDGALVTSQSTFIFSTQEISDSGSSTENKTSAASTENYSTGVTSDATEHVTKEAISSTHRENIETSPDYSSEKSTNTYTTEATSDSTQDEISVKSTTEIIKDELSTQSSTADDDEHRSTNQATKGETAESSTEDQNTSFISETTYSHAQEETKADYTDISDFASETYNTDNTEEITSIADNTEEITSIADNTEETTSTGDDEISTKNTATLATGEPSTQNTTVDEGTSDPISSIGTTTSEIISDLTSSELPFSTKEEGTSVLSRTTRPNSDEPIVSEIMETESYEPSETTQDYFPSSKEMTPTTKLPATTYSTEEIVVSTVQQKEICLATDNTCIVDKDGNVYRCPKSHGHIPHPWDKSKFLHCDNFRIHVINCPTGTRFDAELQICTWAATAKE